MHHQTPLQFLILAGSSQILTFYNIFIIPIHDPVQFGLG
jgi:hypothetical protein